MSTAGQGWDRIQIPLRATRLLVKKSFVIPQILPFWTVLQCILSLGQAWEGHYSHFAGETLRPEKSSSPNLPPVVRARWEAGSRAAGPLLCQLQKVGHHDPNPSTPQLRCPKVGATCKEQRLFLVPLRLSPLEGETRISQPLETEASPQASGGQTHKEGPSGRLLKVL